MYVFDIRLYSQIRISDSYIIAEWIICTYNIHKRSFFENRNFSYDRDGIIKTDKSVLSFLKECSSYSCAFTIK